jgi:N-acetylglucosamine-6-sulfatase
VPEGRATSATTRASVSTARRRATLVGVLTLVAVLVGALLWPTTGARRGDRAAETGSPASLGARPAPAPPQAAGAERPNIVVVMADDMRVDDLAFAPALRRLVADHGVTFTNSFAPYPLCCPNRASFLTGQYAHNHGVYWHEPPWGYGSFDDSRTLATSLRDAGYRTGFIGKYLNRYGVDRSKVSGQPSHRFVPPGWSDWRAAVENPGNAGFHGHTYHYFDTPFNVN